MATVLTADERDWAVAALKKLQAEAWADASGRTARARVQELFPGIPDDQARELVGALYHVFTREPRADLPAWESWLREEGFADLVDRWLPFAVRKEASRRRSQDHEAVPVEAVPAPRSGEPQRDAAGEIEALLATESLTAAERQVVRALADADSLAEVARQLGKDAATVRVLWGRARKKIRPA